MHHIIRLCRRSMETWPRHPTTIHNRGLQIRWRFLRGLQIDRRFLRRIAKRAAVVTCALRLIERWFIVWQRIGAEHIEGFAIVITLVIVFTFAIAIEADFPCYRKKT